MDADPRGPRPMTGRLLAAVFRQAEALAAGAAADLTDADLLRRFAGGRAGPGGPSAEREEAFAALVRRHGPMVWGVCRNVLGAEADAEDAFQATFLALVRSAARVRDPAAVGAWLHGAAVRVCWRAKRAAARRKRREEAAAAPEAAPAADGTGWAELHAAVHEEVARLPARERAVFVLCGLEGARQPDAAARLGLKLNTVSGLLARARRRLLDQLARRGLAPAVAATAAGLGTTAPAAVPDVLINGVLSLAAGPAGPSAAVLELARGAMEGAMTRTRLLAAAVLLAGAVGAGTGAAVLSTAGAQPPGGFPGGGGDPAAAPPAAPGPGGARGPAGGEGGAGMMSGMMGAMGGSGGGGAGHIGPQWEYTTFIRETGNDWVRGLAALGDDGWEVVCVTRYLNLTGSPQQAQEFLLKRQKPQAGTAAAGGGRAGAMMGMMRGGMGPGGMGGPPGAPGMAGSAGKFGGGAAGVPAGGGFGGEGGGFAPGAAPGGYGGMSGAPAGTSGGESANTSVVTLKHLRAADFSPELRKQFGISRVDERRNRVTITGSATVREKHSDLLKDLDEAAGKANAPKP